jgi:outer membrane receptor protein involved in Fe transport
VACFCTLLAGAAWGQGAATPAAPAASAADDVMTVVITAEKRPSTVQKTPVSITVLTGEELQARGITDFLTAAQQTPGLSFKTSGPGQTEYEMRGLTSTGGESPTVGFYLDDIALTPPAMSQNGKVVIDPTLYDLQRVEVLRGPQGTLYGAGSMGGTIKLVTNQPNLSKLSGSVEGIASGTQGGGFGHTENAMLNVPIVKEVAALRLVLTDKTVAGWIDRDVVSPFPLETNNSTTRGDVAAAPVTRKYTDSNWERLRGARAALLVEPTDRLSITGSALYQRITQGAPNTIDEPPGNEVHYQPFDVAEPFADRYALGGLNVKYDFDKFELVSTTAHWQRKQGQTQDISEAMQDYIGGFFGPAADFPFSTTAGGLGAGSITENDNTRQTSEELRLVSTDDGPFQWLAGAYYAKFNATSHVFSYYDGFTALFGTNNLADNHRALDMSQKALFSEVSYQWAKQFKTTLGLRWFSYDSNSATSVSGVSANGTSDTLFGKASDKGFTPKLNFAYTPSNDLTIYSTVAKGFRPGGPNSPIPSPCPVAPTQFGPDSVISYEVGEKARLFDSNLTINGAIFAQDWSDVQQQVAPGCGFKYTANAGKAQSYGAELELGLVVTPGLVLSQSGAWTHATNSTTVPAAGVVAGQRLLDVPIWTASTTLTYRHAISSDLQLVARASNSFVGSSQDLTYARNTLPAYDLVGTRVGVEGGKWTASLFVDNLTNRKAQYSNTGALSANVQIFNRVATNQPRTFGTDLTLKF